LRDHGEGKIKAPIPAYIELEGRERAKPLGPWRTTLKRRKKKHACLGKAQISLHPIKLQYWGGERDSVIPKTTLIFAGKNTKHRRKRTRVKG